MTDNPLRRLYAEQGQAPWLDNISRGLITSGELRKMIDDDGIVGVTSNPDDFREGDQQRRRLRRADEGTSSAAARTPSTSSSS